MLVKQLEYRNFASEIEFGGISLQIGEFDIKVTTKIEEFKENFYKLYGDYTLSTSSSIADFSVSLRPPSFYRRFFRKNAQFFFSNHQPFKPLPLDQTFALFEWGLNWVFATQCHNFLIIHSAVVEKSGKALILPGSPGSGKSTLCAALVCKGWRLLSDEMALVSLDTGLIHPLPRPVSLKNESLDIIREFHPTAVFGTVALDTSKGTVGHMQVPEISIRSGSQRAKPYAVIFPRYQRDSIANQEILSPSETMYKLAENCFNYTQLGKDGFNGLADLAERCQGMSLHYPHLDDAIALINQATDEILHDSK